jgi:hypothetical protein
MVSSSYLARVLPAATLIALASIAGCSSPTPTAPTAPANANVAGLWIAAGSDPLRDYRWTLVQSGTTVTGTGTGPHPLGVTITGTLTGSVAGDTFTFSEEQSWSINGQTQVEHVHADAMRVTGGSMTGQVTFLPLFPPYRPVSPIVTMVRLPQGQ